MEAAEISANEAAEPKALDASVETVTAERLAHGPEAVAHLSNGKTVFVSGAAPGDVVEVRVVEDKPTFARAELVRVVQAGPARESKVPVLPNYAECPWAHVRYEDQVTAKRQAVVDALVRTAHMDAARADKLVEPCVPCKRQWGYRNKIELAVTADAAGRFALGTYAEGTHDIVVSDTAPLAVRYIEKAPKALRGALRYLQRSQDLGIYRVGVRASLRTNDVEIALWTPPSAFPRKAVAKTLKDAVKCSSVVRVIADPGKARKIKKVETLEGRGLWEEKLADARFLTTAPSFFQVNTAQAEKLVKLVLDGLQVEEGTLVADLYSGGGTFSIPLAMQGADVIAVEAAGSSVRDLRRNADVNKVDIEVICEDAARELPELGELDALVVDPPRAGLAKDMVGSIAKANPERVAYVSCNPQTWARDVAEFERSGYRLLKATPVDMFPQTYHVEVVSIFARR